MNRRLHYPALLIACFVYGYAVVPSHAASPYAPIARTLALRLHAPTSHVRCGGEAAGRVMCMVRRGAVTTFYAAQRWRSDHAWHFTLVGAVA